MDTMFGGELVAPVEGRRPSQSVPFCEANASSAASWSLTLNDRFVLEDAKAPDALPPTATTGTFVRIRRMTGLLPPPADRPFGPTCETLKPA